MATKADRKKWDSLHVAQVKAAAAESEFDLALARKYHASYQDSWLTRGQRDKKERLREKRREIESKIIDLLVEISPRGDHWLSGVPAYWLATELTWEDAIRPTNEPLSVVVPGSYGYRDGYVKERRMNMPRGISKDAANFREILEKGVILVGGEIVDNNSISLDDDDPVSVAIMVNVTGYGPHIGTICATQGGHIDSALQAADEILEEWEMDHNQDYFTELEKEHGDDARQMFTETFDGFMWELTPQAFADAIEGTGAEKFIEIDEPEEEEEEPTDDEEQDDDAFSDEEMQSGFVISDARHGGYDVAHEHKHVGHYSDIDEALDAIEAEMKRSNFFPNVYYVNDHGNVDLLDGDGNVIESRV